MSEETEQGEGGTTEVDPKVEATAKSMGWTPKEHFKGDPAKWVDAATYVERGENFLPILRANNRKLAEQLESSNSEVRRLAKLVESSNEAIDELKKYQTEATKREVEKEREKILASLRRAKKDEDVDAEVELTDQLTRVNAALEREPEKKPVKKDEPTEPQVDPALTSWMNEPENSWFLTDARKQALAVSIAAELRRSGNRLEGRAFYDEVSKEVHEYLGSKTSAPPTSKVNGSKGGSGGGGGGSGGKTYKDLPAEAKAACDKFARTLVGPGRAYKDEAAWRAKYAEDFFKE